MLKRLSLRLTAAIALVTLSTTTATVPPAYASHRAHRSSSSQLVQGSSTPADRTPSAHPPTPVPGSSVSLVAPTGFVLSHQFSGFINPDNSSSIVIAELPLEAHAEMTAILSSTPAVVTAAFAERGVELEVESISSLVVGENQVPLVVGTQTINGIQVTKYFTLFAAESTLLLTFNVTELAELSEETVVETIRSIQIAPVLSIEQKVAELPFRFETEAPFQISDVLVGSAVLLTLEDTSPSEGTPLVVIASSVSPVLAADLPTFSAQLLQNSEDFSDGTITSQSPVEFAGGEGYFVSMDLSDSTAFQYVRILPNNFYIRMLAVGDAQTLEDLTPSIEAIQRSVEAEL